MTLYMLDADRNPTPVDPISWDDARRRASLDGSWRVARDVVRGLVVSTVFVGIPSSPSLPHHLFETMVRDLATAGGVELAFDEDLGLRARYTSWADAEAGHARTVEYLRRKLDRGRRS